MLVNEWSTSVDSVKKGPPFSIMKAGNANRTKSKRRSDPYGREKFITYEMELQISHSIGTEISEKSNIQEVEKRHREMNCTPFVRQYDILSNKWGVLLCQKEYQTNDIRQNSKNW